MTQVKTIFLDMDGVIADWNKQFCIISGLDNDTIIKNWPAGVTEIHDVLGITKSQMWGRVGANKDFWLDIPVFPYAHEMVDYLRSRYHVRICTSPSSDPQSVADKLRWLTKHKFKFGSDVHVGKDKHWLAAPDRMLIDDMDKKIEAFATNGGKTFLFPQVWNSSGGYHGDIMQLVKGLL